jgi:glycosidase
MSDNHDEERAVARFGANGALAASVLMFSLDGVPLLYNGMETGDATESGDPALFEKLPVFWHSKGRPPFREIYRGLARLRSDNAAFRNDRVVWLHNSNEVDVVTLMRADDQNEFLVMINFSNRSVTGHVEVQNSREFKPVTPDAKDTPGGFPSFTLKGFDYRIYQRRIAGN